MTEGKPLTKIVRPLSKGQITLPIEFRRRLKIDSETILSLTLKENKIEIVPLRPVPREQTLREYRDDEIEYFLKEDQLDPNTAAKVRRLLGKKGAA
jgi:bifunctional DNA-binding transcriptional regulator/antitoxin component of YhaV-PrlF toxin-antitoxin module